MCDKKPSLIHTVTIVALILIVGWFWGAFFWIENKFAR